MGGRRLPSVPVIVPIEDVPPGVVGMRAVGAFSVDDYNKVIEPELDRVGAGDHQLRLLLHLGPDFTGFGEGAWGELTSARLRTDVGPSGRQVVSSAWITRR